MHHPSIHSVRSRTRSRIHQRRRTASTMLAVPRRPVSRSRSSQASIVSHRTQHLGRSIPQFRIPPLQGSASSGSKIPLNLRRSIRSLNICPGDWDPETVQITMIGTAFDLCTGPDRVINVKISCVLQFMDIAFDVWLYYTTL